VKNVDAILRHQIEINKTPSIVYSIFSSNDILHEFVGGFSDIQNKNFADFETAYHLFSITKTFTALSILQLAEGGEITINGSVRKYLPEFPYSSEITISHLLSHSSGLPNPIPLSWVHLASEHEPFDRDEFFRSICYRNKKTRFGPNDKFAYSNLGYVFLGQLIENVTGGRYEDYVVENIIDRVDIGRHLGFTNRSDVKKAKGYHRKFSVSNLILGLLFDREKFMNGEENGWLSFKECYVNGPSYGGLIGTMQGLKKYLQEFLRPDCRLLNPDFKPMLFTENVLHSGKQSRMCFSWFSDHLGNTKYYTHAGGGGGYYGEIRLYPEKKIGSVILLNRTGMTDERFLSNVDKFFF